jgi:C4-dicarboxylate transporter, DctM subunit
LVATAGGIAILIPPSIPLLIYGLVTETSVVRLFFAGVIPGLLLALGNILTVIGIALYLKLPRSGRFDAARALRESKGALPALGMPLLILGGLYGGLFTPTEAAAAACGYAMLYGLVVRRTTFLRELLPTAMRAMNLTGVIVFLVGSVGVFQFLAANMYWPQKITDTIVGWGLTPLGFIFAYMGVLLILGMFVDGVAMILLTVPVIFPVAYAMKIDPVALGIMLTLNIEMGVVTPPVGLNLFAVSGTSKIPLHDVIKGTIPFFMGDGAVLLLVIFFPGLATWLPDMLVKSVF